MKKELGKYIAGGCAEKLIKIREEIKKIEREKELKEIKSILIKLLESCDFRNTMYLNKTPEELDYSSINTIIEKVIKTIKAIKLYDNLVNN